MKRNLIANFLIRRSHWKLCCFIRQVSTLLYYLLLPPVADAYMVGCSITLNASSSSQTNSSAGWVSPAKALCCHSSVTSGTPTLLSRARKWILQSKKVLQMTTATQRSLHSWELLAEESARILEYLVWECKNSYFYICDERKITLFFHTRLPRPFFLRYLKLHCFLHPMISREV